MSDLRERTIQQMARSLKPHLWGDFAEKLAKLSIFTPEQAEESAAKKRAEAMLDAEVMLPAAVMAVTDEVREIHQPRETCDCDDRDCDCPKACESCDQGWPCETELLLAALERDLGGKP